MKFLLLDIQKWANILFVNRLCVSLLCVFGILLGFGIEPYTACANVQSQCRFDALSDLPHKQDRRNLIVEQNAPSSLLRAYLWGQDLSGAMPGDSENAGGIGGLLIVREHSPGGTAHFVAYDGNGNVMALVDASTKEIAAQYEYSPFGELIRATGPLAKTNPFRWSTKFWDEETGLVYYGARYYSPSLGRFINRDPIGERGGLNLFAFTGNNPVNWVDPLGAMTLIDNNVALQTAWGLHNEYDNAVLSVGNALFHVLMGVQAGKEAEAILMDYWYDTAIGLGVGLAAGKLITTVEGALFGTASRSGASASGIRGANAGAKLSKSEQMVSAANAVRAAKSGVLRNPNVYEVLYEAPISGTTRNTHRASANRHLAIQLRNNPNLANMMNQQLGGNVRQHMESGRKLLNPPGTVWHHPANNPSVIQLLRASEHKTASLQPVLHPGGVGGFGSFYGP